MPAVRFCFPGDKLSEHPGFRPHHKVHVWRDNLTDDEIDLRLPVSM